jgi:membrane protein DedA with SNARE-associated domain
MFSDTQQIILLLQTYKYLILFPIVVIEGPIVTILAAFLSSLGYLNIFIVYIIVVIGDVAGDCIYYAVGRWGGRNFIDRWGKYAGVSSGDVLKLESHFIKHTKKTLILGKLTHVFGGVILVAAGIAKIPLIEFIFYNLLPTLPKSLLLIIIGYHFGESYKQINKGLGYLSILSVVLIVVSASTLIIFRIYFNKILSKNS